MIIFIALAVLFFSAPAADAVCEENQVRFSSYGGGLVLRVENRECLNYQTCDEMKWKGLDGNVCPFESKFSLFDFYRIPMHLPGIWEGNKANFVLEGQTLNVTEEFNFDTNYGYYPTYGGIDGDSLERVDNNNEFFGIKLKIIRREDNSIVQEGEKVGISTPVSITAVAENIPDHMTASVYDLKMVGQNTATPLQYKLWSRGSPTSSCLTCEGKRNKVDNTVEIWENSFPEFSKTMNNNVDDKIQMKYEVKVTACGTGRPCRSDRYKIGGMMEVESRSRIRREVESSSRVKREVESSSRIRREVLDYLDNEPREDIVKKPMIERPIVVEDNEKIRISFGANIVLLAIYFVVVNYVFIKYFTSKQ